MRSRRRAILAGLSLLFTGAACKNTRRFTRSARGPMTRWATASRLAGRRRRLERTRRRPLHADSLLLESGGGDIYVTDTACSAPPDYKNETNQKTGSCAEALKVYGRAIHVLCPAGAGGGGGGFITTN